MLYMHGSHSSSNGSGIQGNQTQADSESIGKAHEEVASKHMVTISPILPSPSLHLWSHPEFLMVSGQGEEKTGPSSQIGLCDMQAPAESGQL